MNRNPGFRAHTRKLPCRTEAFSPGAAVEGYQIQKMISMDTQKTVFLLQPKAVLCVRHGGCTLKRPILEALSRGTEGLVKVLKAGTLENHSYTIDQWLDPLPPFEALSDERKHTILRQMAQAVEQLHSLGYCHLDLKPEHFRLTPMGRVALIDLDSAEVYGGGAENTGDRLSYTPEYCGPEVLLGTYSTASDYYSLGMTFKALLGREGCSRLPGSCIQSLTEARADRRYNGTQLMQVLNGMDPETSTGPRTYIRGERIGGKTAYSDRQLAMYLSQDYEAARNYAGSRSSLLLGASPAARAAYRIHSLDPALPLMWEGRALPSTAALAREMEEMKPQMNPSMLELLKSGILLKFTGITAAGPELTLLLNRASAQPAANYWQVCRAFGGHPPAAAPVPGPAAAESAADKRAELRRLVLDRISHGQPGVIAGLLGEYPARPTGSALDAMLSRLRCIPSVNGTNHTNLNFENAFGGSILTVLPKPGHYPVGVNPEKLFPKGALYIISDEALQAWQESNTRQKLHRKQRNSTILRILGFLLLGAVVILLLPYAALALFVFMIVCLFLSGM